MGGASLLGLGGWVDGVGRRSDSVGGWVVWGVAPGTPLGPHWVIVGSSLGWCRVLGHPHGPLGHVGSSFGSFLGHCWVIVGSSLGWCMGQRHPHGCMGPTPAPPSPSDARRPPHRVRATPDAPLSPRTDARRPSRHSCRCSCRFRAPCAAFRVGFVPLVPLSTPVACR